MTASDHIDTELVQNFNLSFKAVRLEMLDEQKKILRRATGFLVRDADGLFLYTCWHVVTGVNFFNPYPKERPIARRFMKLSCQDVVIRAPGVQSIGGTHSIEVGLYDSSGNPKWHQEPNDLEQPDLRAIDIRVPKFVDMVRIPVEFNDQVASNVEFKTNDILSVWLQAGRDVMILGYPYGYSAMGPDTPSPIFLKRMVASTMTEHAGRTLLDGVAAPGMSGSPVVAYRDGRWWLWGMYTGGIFPDHQHGPERPENDRRAALGTMVQVHVGRAFMQVPGVFDQFRTSCRPPSLDASLAAACSGIQQLRTDSRNASNCALQVKATVRFGGIGPDRNLIDLVFGAGV